MVDEVDVISLEIECKGIFGRKPTKLVEVARLVREQTRHMVTAVGGHRLDRENALVWKCKEGIARAGECLQAIGGSLCDVAQLAVAYWANVVCAYYLKVAKQMGKSIANADMQDHHPFVSAVIADHDLLDEIWTAQLSLPITVTTYPDACTRQLPNVTLPDESQPSLPIWLFLFRGDEPFGVKFRFRKK